MNDITALALLVSKAKASVFTMEYISQFDASDIDSDDVDLRFEVDGVETGTNVSIVDECGQAAQMITALVEALEKAQQHEQEWKSLCEAAAVDLDDWREIDDKSRGLIYKLADAVIAKSERIAELERYAEAEATGADKAAESGVYWMKRYRELESRTVTSEKLQESSYRAGLTTGWNLGLENNNAAFNKCLASHSTAGIAKLESRTVTVKLYGDFQLCHYGTTEDYAKGYIDCQNNFTKWLSAAGINVEAE